MFDDNWSAQHSKSILWPVGIWNKLRTITASITIPYAPQSRGMNTVVAVVSTLIVADRHPRLDGHSTEKPSVNVWHDFRMQVGSETVSKPSINSTMRFCWYVFVIGCWIQTSSYLHIFHMVTKFQKSPSRSPKFRPAHQSLESDWLIDIWAVWSQW